MYDEVVIVTDIPIFDQGTSYYIVLVMADPSSSLIAFLILLQVI